MNPTREPCGCCGHLLPACFGYASLPSGTPTLPGTIPLLYALGL